MSKKALLVTFEVTTRILVPIPDEADDETIITLARHNIQGDLYNYISGDNLTEVAEDQECPYYPEDEINL